MGALFPLAVLAYFLLGKKSGAAATAPAAAAPVVTFGPATDIQVSAKPRPRPAGSRPGGSVELVSVTPNAPASAAKPVAAKPAAKPPTANEALQAAMLADQQMGKPKPTQQATVRPVAAPPGKPAAAVVQVIPDPRPSALPPGYDAAAASARAQPMADHLRTRKSKYDRAVLSSWQQAAGLKQDGLYGPQSAAALRYFGAKNVPAPMFKGSQTTYTPPKG